MVRQLLSREEFREQVFARDAHTCLMCDEPAVDAHHIIERRLFPDGGYYLGNGASLCSHHHLEAEQTTLDAQTLRDAAGITEIVLPDHLYDDLAYTKWGDVILEDGTRSPGELFYDESVQKILRRGGMLGRYTPWVKHPRTHHLPSSPGVNDDDRIIATLDDLRSGEVVVTVKLDGEQTTMYSDHVHARSLTSGYHQSRTRVKSVWGRIRADIPPGWRVCGENVAGVHSIVYRNLPSVFFVHSIWEGSGRCLDFDQTAEWASLLEVPMAPMLWRGRFDDAPWGSFWPHATGWCDEDEGYVVRTAAGFDLAGFATHVGKWVRAGHVQPSAHHWAAGPYVPNGLAPDAVT